MIHGKRVCVVLPAYNAAGTLASTLSAIPRDVVDDVVLVDDASTDDTVAVAQALGLSPVVHSQNRGYGANQKTCYRTALAMGADVIAMVHPDGQYDPRLVPAMASLVALGRHDVVLGTRVLGRGPRHGGMPVWRHVANKGLTTIENLLLDRSLSEWHTGLRAYSRGALERIPFASNSDDFIFDNELLVQAVHLGLEIGEVSGPARYGTDTSSIPPGRAVRYGIGVLRCALGGWAARVGICEPAMLVGLGPRPQSD